MTDDTLDKAYYACLQMAQRHYENFPTASRLLTGAHRRATAAIYAFARRADDIADEGNMSASERHAQLDILAMQLSQVKAGKSPVDPLFLALADTVHHYQLPFTPFEKLLAAFRSDIDTRRFADFAELATYCDHSANPVGELILRLHDKWDEENARYSNAICTALQLINFVQDLDSDYRQRERIYIPLDEMQEYGVTEDDIAQRHQSGHISNLIHYQLQRAHDLLISGQPILTRTRGRLRLILTFTLFCAVRILAKLESRSNVFSRPTLHAGDMTLIAMRSLLFQSVKPTC